MITRRQYILSELEPLIQQAEREGKLLVARHDPTVRFTPKELREQHESGSFIWGIINWKLLPDVELRRNTNGDGI